MIVSNATTFLAVWGALVATFGLGWNIYRDLIDRPKLQVSAEIRRIAVNSAGKFFSLSPSLKTADSTESLYVIMTVVNVGRRPVMWQGWGGKYRKPVNGKNGFFIVGRDLPKMLREGESHSECTELDGDTKAASENVRRLHIWDSAGNEWAIPRKELTKLKQDAREAMAKRV